MAEKVFQQMRIRRSVHPFTLFFELQELFLLDVILPTHASYAARPKFVFNSAEIGCPAQVPWHVMGIPLAFPLCCPPLKFPLDAFKLAIECPVGMMCPLLAV